MTSRRAFAVLAALTLLSACSLRNVACGRPVPPPQTDQAAVPPSPSGESGEAPTFKIAFLGDSLTAGLNLLSQQAYPALIQEMFGAEGYDQIESVNAGISGDTSAGGRRRIDQTLEPGVRILVLALGANDALRGLGTQQTHDNLKAIIDTARGKGVRVALCGMEAPTNLGPDYRDAFRGVFVQLAREYRADVKFVPFLLEGVAGHPELNQADGIHPNEQGAKVIAALLYPTLRTIVDELGGGGQ
ncbi:MAG TPA: arylesterase [Vicinamibacterales bacterium]|nr:arylesterase [Vicinamibacterales bacterium]